MAQQLSNEPYSAACRARHVRRAEAEYYDSISRFGINSSEAFASEAIWRHLRNEERNRR